MSFKYYDLQTLGQCIAAALLCLVPLTMVGQQGGRSFDGVSTGIQLDNTWTAWSVTSDLDPRAHTAPFLPTVEFRWRRVHQAEKQYTCEVEFRNSGKVARDFEYTLSYDTAEGALTSRKQGKGTRLGVVGVASIVVIPNCFTVAPVATIDALQQGQLKGLGPWARSGRTTFSLSADGRYLIVDEGYRSARSLVTDRSR